MSQFMANTEKETNTTTANTSNTTTVANSPEDNEQFLLDNRPQQHQPHHVGKKVTIANKHPIVSLPIPVTTSTTTTVATSTKIVDKIDDYDDLSAHVAMLRQSSRTTLKLKVEEKLDSLDDDYKMGLSIEMMNSSLLHDSPKNARMKRVEMANNGGLLDMSGKSISMSSTLESPRLLSSPRAGEELLIFGDLEL